MWFRIARELGMSVRRAKQEVDSKEYALWGAFFAIAHHPEDIRTARICNVIASCAGVKDSKMEHYLPRLAGEAFTRPSPKELSAKIRSSLGLAGKVKG